MLEFVVVLLKSEVQCASVNEAVQESGFRAESQLLLEEFGLETEHQLPADYLRVRSIPFSDEVYDFIRNHDRIYVVEMNRDGQLHQILRLNIPECTSKLISVAHIDGMPLTAKWICGEITAQEAK